MTPYRRWITLVAVLLAVTAAGCGSLNLASEPEVVSTLLPRPTQMPTTAGEAVTLPEAHPNLTVGAAVFANNCTACHGIDGAGNGELVVSEQVPYPGDMTDWEAVAVDTPTDWYNIITVGNLENLMPPWAGSLSEEERWAVAMYNYTRSYTPEQVEMGGGLYVDNCAACHGATGTGEGAQAIEAALTPGDLTDATVMVTYSDEDIYNALAMGPTGAEDHAFADDLDETELRALTAYTRTLSLDGLEIIGGLGELPADAEMPAASAGSGNEGVPANLEDAMVAIENGTISGTVTNDTPDGTIPENTTVELRIFDEAREQGEIMETTLTDGTFTFENITINPNYVYVALITHQNRQFISEPTLGVDATGDTLDLPLSVYEVTDNAEVITIESLAVQVTPQEDRLQVAQFVIFNNNSDRLYSQEATDENGDTIYTSVKLSLPPGSIVGGFTADPNRYVIDAENFTVTDTQPVLPGDGHMMQLVYFIPFTDGAIIEHPLDYDLNGIFRLLMSTDTIEVSGEGIESFGPVDIGEGVYYEYGGNVNLTAGEEIRYDLNLLAGNRSLVGTGGNSRILPITLFVLSGVSALLAAGLFIYGRMEDRRKGDSKEIDALVSQIAQLDKLHDAGDINHDVYQRQRTELKAKLRDLMAKPDGLERSSEA